MFFKQTVTNKYNDNGWITAGIHTSCRHKEFLYILNRNINKHLFKLYYRSYCIILRRVIREAKRKYYNCLIAAAEYRLKIFLILKQVRKNNNNRHCSSRTFQNNNKTLYINEAAQSFNKYYVSIIEGLNMKKTNVHIAMQYLHTHYSNVFPDTNFITSK
jgi:hypothetical protein